MNAYPENNDLLEVTLTRHELQVISAILFNHMTKVDQTHVPVVRPILNKVDDYIKNGVRV